MSVHQTPLVPKDPKGPLRVILIGRLSKEKDTEEDTNESLASSIADLKRRLAGIYDGPIELIELAEQASGLISDRETILKAWELVETGKIDLVAAEDLSRIYRNPRFQYTFVQDCVDWDTRVICFADNLDTADENWELMMGVASLRHGMTIPETRRREKRKATHVFHQGGQVQKIRFGYRKLSRGEAKSGEFGPPGLRIAKLPEATPIIKEMAGILKETLSYRAVLDWLDENGIPPGPYAKSGKWSQALLKNLFTDPILKGTRRYRQQLYQRIFRTGRFRRKTNPDGADTEHYPELAHLTEEEFNDLQRTVATVAELNEKNGESPCKGRARSDALFPYQHAVCSACGHLMHAYNTHHLKCQNAHERGDDQCWNHVQVNTEMARARIVRWILAEGEQVPGFRDALVDFAWTELQTLVASEDTARRDEAARRANLERQADSLARAIREGGELPSLLRQLKEVERILEALPEPKSNSGPEDFGGWTKEKVNARLEEVVSFLAANSYEFGKLMREVLPVFEIVPVQAIDSGLVRPRARVTLRLTAEPDEPTIETTTEIDLFDPPKHFRFMDECLRLKQAHPKWSYVKIAAEINRALAKTNETVDSAETISYMTVKRCFSISRQMESEGLAEPYRELTRKPGRASRWKPRRTTDH